MQDSFEIGSNWLTVLRHLPLECRGLLLDLVVEAAQQRSHVLAIDQALLESLARNAQERAHVSHWFTILQRHGLVREVDAGMFLIAPGLWTLGGSAPSRPKLRLV